MRRVIGRQLPGSAAVPARQIAEIEACVRRLASADDAESVSAIRVALWSVNDEVARVVSRTLAEHGSPALEETLTAALQHRLADVQLDAVRTLGRIGSVAAVAPLGDWASRHALDRWVRGAARQAIAEIQSRLPSASPGQLSIAAGEAGEVSLADEDTRGEVSLEKPGG